jgi:hypothetical protein
LKFNNNKLTLKQLSTNRHHALLVYGDDVNVLGEIVHTVKGNAEFVEAASKEIGLEVNADKSG